MNTHHWDKKEYWKGLEKLHLTSHYRYFWGKAENIVEIQDPGKSVREVKIMQKYLPKHCGEVLLDYGCGEGKMFKYIKERYKKYPLIIGVDPDKFRLEKARKKLLSDNGMGVFLNTTLKNKIFYQTSLKNSIFCALCIQVLGHLPTYELYEILSVFHHLLEFQGTLIIAIPVVNNEFEFPKWERGNDFFHLVNLSLSPKSPKFRILIDVNKFNFFINHPRKDLLPVRSFFINEKIEIGHICDRNKIESSSIGRVLKKCGFVIEKVEVYSKHEKGIGDIMIKTIKK